MALFEPDALAAEQWARVCRSRALTGEQRLMRAVLMDAKHDLERYRDQQGGRARAIYREAFEWFRSTQRDWPFSFVSVCERFGLDPSAVRKQLGVAT